MGSDTFFGPLGMGDSASTTATKEMIQVREDSNSVQPNLAGAVSNFWSLKPIGLFYPYLRIAHFFW